MITKISKTIHQTPRQPSSFFLLPFTSLSLSFSFTSFIPPTHLHFQHFSDIRPQSLTSPHPSVCSTVFLFHPFPSMPSQFSRPSASYCFHHPVHMSSSPPIHHFSISLHPPPATASAAHFHSPATTATASSGLRYRLRVFGSFPSFRQQRSQEKSQSRRSFPHPNEIPAKHSLCPPPSPSPLTASSIATCLLLASYSIFRSLDAVDCPSFPRA